tara:strand:- start:567 stop:803 length:237 start_codon:yes stop_codon:yes gene_type:complete
MTIEEVLNKRYRWETLVGYGKTFVLPSYESTIDNLEHFVEYGHENNRFRKNFSEAIELAKEIVTYHEKPMGALDKGLA